MKRAITLIAVIVVAATLVPRRVTSHETLTTTVLFDREIVRILNKHCVMCHAERGPAFPLETYEQTWVQGRKIRTDVIARHMPPWPAVAGYGEFVNDNSLTLRETQFMVSWVEGLGPRNAGTVFLNVQDSAAAKPKVARAQPDFDRWQLGRPTTTRPLPATTIPSSSATTTSSTSASTRPSSVVSGFSRTLARSADRFTRTTIDLGLTSERRLRGLEYLPSDRRVVRAVFFTLKETGQWLGSWTPWYGFASLPAGISYRLPAGSHIVAEIHYRNEGEPVVERGTLGLFFEEDATQKRGTKSFSSPRKRGLTPFFVVLDAKGDGGQSNRMRASARLAGDTFVFALRPEVPAGVSSLEVSARSPSGATDVLLFAKGLSTDWPTPFILKEPVLLRRGTTLSVTAYYANIAGASRPEGVRLTVATFAR